jgi:hypothetical protein
VSQDHECSTSLTEGLLQIVVLDDQGQQMPGVHITIARADSEEHFFTGLKPETGNGYADYVMERGVTYSVRLAQTGTPVSGLTRLSCADSNAEAHTGGLKLTFRQPQSDGFRRGSFTRPSSRPSLELGDCDSSADRVLTTREGTSPRRVSSSRLAACSPSHCRGGSQDPLAGMDPV